MGLSNGREDAEANLKPEIEQEVAENAEESRNLNRR
jgi:hypothetical protein